METGILLTDPFWWKALVVAFGWTANTLLWIWVGLQARKRFRWWPVKSESK